MWHTNNLLENMVLCYLCFILHILIKCRIARCLLVLTLGFHLIRHPCQDGLLIKGKGRVEAIFISFIWQQGMTAISFLSAGEDPLM